MPDITMPKLSDTMTEGTLVHWKKKPGDKVSVGDVIAEVETDKATMEMESFEDGVIQKLFIKEGDKVQVGQKIATIADKKGAATQTQPAQEPEKQPDKAAAKNAKASATTAPVEKSEPAK